MMTIGHHASPRDASYAVPGPRVTDAIGEALRNAYRQAAPLPDDLGSLIATMDRSGHR